MNKTRDAYTQIGRLLTSGPAYESSIIWNYMEEGYPCECHMQGMGDFVYMPDRRTSINLSMYMSCAHTHVTFGN